jgi:hypothetical protein
MRAPIFEGRKERSVSACGNCSVQSYNDSLTISARRRKHQANHTCCEQTTIEDGAYEKNANICRLRDLYFRNGLRSRSNKESGFYSSCGDYRFRASRRAIKYFGRRRRRAMYDGIHTNAR